MVGGVKTASRARVSCTECHRRRKACDECLPCRNCLRRYPPVECIYKPHPKRRPKVSGSSDKAEPYPPNSLLHAPGPNATAACAASGTLPCQEGSSKSVLTGGRPVSNLLDVTLPSRSQPSPLESQIPVCGLVNHFTDLLNPEEKSPAVLAMAENIRDLTALPPAFGSGIMDMLPSLQVAPTAGNAELFSIYVKVLVPWLWTVDGNAIEAPPGCWQSWIPFSIFSPMILYTSLHRAAIWREMVRPTALRVEVNSMAIASVTPECIVWRGKAFTLLRNHLRSSGPVASSDEAIATVVCIFFNEWSWSIEHGTRNIQPHIKVLCAMLKIRGGTSNLNSHARGLLMIIHYRLAAVLEREPSAFPAHLIADHFVPDYRPVKSTFDSPLYLSSGSFVEKGSEIGLHAITAQILDDLTLVLEEIRYVILKEDSKNRRNSILQNAIQVQDRISSLRSAKESNHPTATDYIYETCRLASLIYLRAIINHTQFSKTWHPEELNKMFSAIQVTPMQYWKPLSGVWLFVLLSINPARDDLYPGAMSKFFLITSSFHMAAWDWQCWVNIMETYLALQKWFRTPGDVQISRTGSPSKTSTATDVEDT